MNGTLPLVDVLRQQVAHLVHELAERDSVLHERTRHLRVAQGLAHLGSWEWEVESGAVRCSSELCRIFGREPGADLLTFDGFLAVVFPDDRDRVMASINHALGGQASYDVEYRIVRPNGDVRTIHSCAEVLRGPISSTGAIRAVEAHSDLDFYLYIIGHYEPFGPILGMCVRYAMRVCRRSPSSATSSGMRLLLLMGLRSFT